jgi:membrane fusion protein, multidrug efflux system
MDDLANEWRLGLLQCVLWMARSSDSSPVRIVLRWLIARVSVLLDEAALVALDEAACRTDRFRFREVVYAKRDFAQHRLPNVCRGHTGPSIGCRSRRGRDLSLAQRIALRATRPLHAAMSFQSARNLVAGGVLAVGIAATSCAMADGVPLPQVTIAHPKAMSVPRWDEYTGRFEPLQKVEVRPRVSGAIDAINFVDGQFVKKGDLLYVIDRRPYQLTVDMAKADLARTQAQVAVAANDVARAEQLVGSSAITLRDADQRKASLAVAQAQQLGAEAALRNAELNLEWTEVRAPIDGRISDHRVDVGNLVEGGQAGATLLTTIVTLSPIHFVFDASETDYIRYARLASAEDRSSSREFRNPVMVRLADEPDWSHSHGGVMDFVDNQINARSGTIRGRAVFENKDLFLAPGTFGRLRLFGGTASALLIPDTSILSDQASKIVLAVGDDNKVVQKIVTLGAMYKGLRVVLAGLSESDRIVITGVANPLVRPGAMVRPDEGTIAISESVTSN